MMSLAERRENSRLKIAAKRAGSSEFREANRAYSRAYGASHREERRAYTKRYRLMRDYGLTLEDFQTILVSQNGKCAICEIIMGPPSRVEKDSKAVTVDHCHETGKVRGLLCYSCNLGIGILKDSLPRLRNAVSYLEKHEVTELSESARITPSRHIP